MENYAVLTAAREQYDVYVVQDLEDFVAENRYPTAQKLTEYTAHGGTADATDAYAYAEKVVSLKQYEPQLEFLRCVESTWSIVDDGNTSLGSAIDAYKDGYNDLACAYLKSAARYYQTAHDSAAAFD